MPGESAADNENVEAQCHNRSLANKGLQLYHADLCAISLYWLIVILNPGVHAGFARAIAFKT